MKKFLYNILKNNKKILLISICFLVILTLYPNICDAQSATGQSNFEDGIAKAVSYILKLISIFIWVILAFIGALMDNEFIIGKGIEPVLHQIWLVARNFVNVGFALALIAAAVYMVIKPGGEGGVDIKTQLPRFLLAMILVNFSWLGARLVLQTSSVLTSAVFAIPTSIETQAAKCTISIPQKDGTFKTIPDTNCFNVRDIIIKPGEEINLKNGNPSVTKKVQGKTDSSDTDNSDSGLSTDTDSDVPGERRYTITWQKALSITLEELKSSASFNQNNAVMIMALNLGSIHNLPLVASKIGNKSALTINIIFSLIMIVIIVIPLIILFIVLIGRMVILWLTIAFMPLVFLGWVIKGSFTSALFEGMPDVFEQFLNAAFIPVYVGFPLSIGFLMINAGIRLLPTLDKLPGGVNIKFDGGIAGMGDTRMILWYIATAGVIWTSVSIASSKGPEFTQSTVSWIGDTAKSWGKWLATAPIKYAPIMPVYKGKDGKPSGNYSFANLFQLPDILRNKLESSDSSRAHDLAKRLTGDDNITNLHIPDRTKKELAKYMNNNGGNKQNIYNDKLRDRYKQISNQNDPNRDINRFKDDLNKIFPQLGFDRVNNLSTNELKNIFRTIDRSAFERLDQKGFKWDELGTKDGKSTQRPVTNINLNPITNNNIKTNLIAQQSAGTIQIKSTDIAKINSTRDASIISALQTCKTQADYDAAINRI